MSPNPERIPRQMAQVSGSPGSRIRLLGLLHTLWPLGVALAAGGYLARAAWPWPPLSPSFTGLLFLMLAVAVAAGANASRRRLGHYLKGARGEESVARALALLPGAWHVFHGIADRQSRNAHGGRDLDHVAVGPNGIFAIETKNWSGAITARDHLLLCDGVAPDRDPIAQIREAAAGLCRMLSDEGVEDVPVVPVLCFTGHGNLRGLTGLDGVLICTESRLADMLLRHQENGLSPARREAVIRRLAAATARDNEEDR